MQTMVLIMGRSSRASLSSLADEAVPFEDVGDLLDLHTMQGLPSAAQERA